MKLSKAIEIVSDSCNRGVTTFNQDYKDAQKLLIEAGKRCQSIWDSPHPQPRQLLPGETEY